MKEGDISFNPCFSGSCTLTLILDNYVIELRYVSILVLVEVAL